VIGVEAGVGVVGAAVGVGVSGAAGRHALDMMRLSAASRTQKRELLGFISPPFYRQIRECSWM